MKERDHIEGREDYEGSGSLTNTNICVKNYVGILNAILNEF